MPISNKLRFEVFKRDGFRCAYCGKTPPEVVLECDHIEPVKEGGQDVMENLITACFECNRGKGCIPLEKIPTQVQTNIEILKEKEAQLREYRKYAAKLEKMIQKDIDEVVAVYSECFKGWTLEERFKQSTIKTFLKSLSKEEIKEAMYLAANKVRDNHRTIRYFCGICWNKIKAKGQNA
jgi:hypothetical protein